MLTTIVQDAKEASWQARREWEAIDQQDPSEAQPWDSTAAKVKWMATLDLLKLSSMFHNDELLLYTALSQVVLNEIIPMAMREGRDHVYNYAPACTLKHCVDHA